MFKSRGRASTVTSRCRAQRLSTQSVERVQESRQSIDCDIAGAKHHCCQCIQESRQSIDSDIAGAEHHCCQRRALNVFKNRGRASTVSTQVHSTTVVNAER